MTRFDEMMFERELEVELERRRRLRRKAHVAEIGLELIVVLAAIGAAIALLVVFQATRPGPDDRGDTPAQPETSDGAGGSISETLPERESVVGPDSRTGDASDSRHDGDVSLLLAAPATRDPFVTAKASYYCNADPSRGKVSRCRVHYPDGAGADLYAAAGPAVQRMMGSDWQGEQVRVIGNGRDVTVTLIDSCPGCSGVDLYADAFVQLAPLSRGTLELVLIRPARGPLATVPPTDTR